MNKLTKKISAYTLGVIGALTINSAVYRINQTEQAVITQFGKPVKVIVNPVETGSEERRDIVQNIQKEIDEYAKKEGTKAPQLSTSGAGLKVKLPFIEKVKRFDRRLLEWDGFPEQIPTKDKKYLFVDTTARYYIDDPLRFYRTVGGDEERASGKLDDIIDSVVREQISRRDSIESVRSTNRKMEVSDKELEETVKVDNILEGRDELFKKITLEVRKQCETYGMHVVDVMAKRLIYVDEVKKSIEDRMIAERERIKQKYLSEGDGEAQRIMGEKEREVNRIRSEAYKKAEDIKGKADAEATKIYADTFNLDPGFYKFIKSLEVLKENAKGTTLVLDKDNPLFKYLGREEIKK
jgi:membrane protease subunit HflC